MPEDRAVRPRIRHDIDVKNLLATGEVSPEEVMEVIGRARGDCYTSSPHHYDGSVEVHILTPKYARQEWYIKWYLVEPNCFFISVHH